MTAQIQNTELVGLTADIVSAYVRNNTVVASSVPALIADVSAAVCLAAAKSAVSVEEDLTPAVPIRKSVTPDYIICLEDGKKFKSLKRHLRTYYDLSPEEYRERWGLGQDYPMVAPNYSKARSEFAKNIGLGRKPKS